MGIPNFICIGAQKAGTTWLHHMLKQHPDVWLPPVKEIHFFDRSQDNETSFAVNLKRYQRAAKKIKKRISKEKLNHLSYELDYLTSLTQDDFLTETWYRRIFDHKFAIQKVSGEITPAYLDMHKSQVAEAARILDSTKFIAIIRDPLARAMSQLRMTVERRKITSVTDQSWQRFVKHLKRDPRGLYHRSIPNWIDAVGEARLLLLPFSMVKNEPKQLLENVEDFIGASRFTDYAAMEDSVNVTPKIEIPDWVVAKLTEQTAPAKKFLIDRFGEDFYQRTI